MKRSHRFAKAILSLVSHPEPTPARADAPAQSREALKPTVVSPTVLLENFDEVSRIVEDEGKRIAIREDGRTIAGLVSESDLQALDALEELLDELDARDALADYRANGGVSFEEVMSELGL